MKPPETLFNRDFIILNAVLFLAYCNIALFFQFPIYLEKGLGVSTQWVGILLSVFALTGLVIRPFASAVINPANARSVLMAGAVAVVITLVLYYPARSVPGLLAVRIAHGLAYVVFGTAVMTAIVSSVPRDRSGQAFGLIAVITLLPYAAIPPLLRPLLARMGGFVPLLLLFSLLMLLVLPLSMALGRRGKAPGAKEKNRITREELIANMKDGRLLILFLASLLLFTSFAATFFYLKGFGLETGVNNPGWFFTISTFMEIGVRLTAGSYFDRVDKALYLALSMALLGPGYFLLATVHATGVFFGLAFLFGLCWGVALPLFNSLIFDFSKPRLRPFNTNLGLEMFQGGFFLGSLGGGMALSSMGYRAIFQGCGLLCLACFALMLILRGRERIEES